MIRLSTIRIFPNNLQKDTALLGPPKALKDQPSRDYYVSTANRLSNLLLPELSWIYQIRKELTDSKSQSCVALTEIRFQSTLHHAQYEAIEASLSVVIHRDGSCNT